MLTLVVSSLANAQQEDRSFRIGTFNTYMKPATGPGFCLTQGTCELFNSLEDTYAKVDPAIPCNLAGPGFEWCTLANHIFSDEQLEQGARDLAARIKLGGYDVIILEEVFNETARDTLIAELESEYPNIFVKADAPGDVVAQDAGLMLFAKPHLELVPSPFLEGCGGEAGPPYGAGWSTTVRVAGDDCTYDSRDPGYSCMHPVFGPYASFREFGAHTPAVNGTDDGYLANKGVAFVKLHDVTTGLSHAVFFTHTQAYRGSMFDVENSDKDELYETEAFQWHVDELAEIQDFYECLESTAFFPGVDHVYLLGDLNINGDQGAPFDAISGEFMSPMNDNRGEWSVQLSQGFFGAAFDDAWVKETPNVDRGLTSDGHWRLDYIFHQSPTGDPQRMLCNQHMTLAYNLRDYDNIHFEGGIDHGGRGPSVGDGSYGLRPFDKWYSDHLGVNANYNECTPQSTPLSFDNALGMYGNGSFGAHVFTPFEVGNTLEGDPDFDNPGQLHIGALEVPGALDWWRLNFEGQYIVGLTTEALAAGFRVAVYHEADMSRPMKAYRDESFTLVDFQDQEDAVVQEYSLLHPPYYVKVYNLAHQATDSYGLVVHRLNCSNKYAMACPMYPNQPNGSFRFPYAAVNSSPSPDSLYFQLDLQEMREGDAQEFRTVVSNYASNELGTFIVGPHDDTTLLFLDDVLMNTFEEQRTSQNGFPISGKPYPSCPPTPGAGPAGFEHFPGCNNIIGSAFIGDGEEPGADRGERLFLRVTRVDAHGVPSCEEKGCSEISFEPTWQTDVSVMPLEEELIKDIPPPAECATPKLEDHTLTSIDQQDWPSETDEMRMRMWFQGIWYAGYELDNYSTPTLDPPAGICNTFNAFWLAHMDPDGDASKTVGLSKKLADLRAHPGFLDTPPIRFQTDLRVDVVEEDDCPNLPDPPTDGPEWASFYFPPLSLNSFREGAGLECQQQTVSFDDGEYALAVHFMHGTQEHMPPFSDGNIARQCDEEGSCALSSSPAIGDGYWASSAVDADPEGTLFQAIFSSSGTFWQLEFMGPRFVSNVRIRPRDGFAYLLDNIDVGVSQDGMSWYEIHVGAFPTGSEYHDIVFGLPARFVRIQNPNPSQIAMSDVEIYGY